MTTPSHASAPLPSLFVSHGAPSLLLEDVPARDFLAGLGPQLDRTYGRPRAVVAISAHDMARLTVVGSAERLETIHDFWGFPDELYRRRYNAPGSPDLAQHVAGLLGAAGINHAVADAPGLDHGAWVPLTLMYPAADIPVVPVSLSATLDERQHLALGRALASLRREGVLVLASGSTTHNLRDLGRHLAGTPEGAYVDGFAEWLAATLAAGDEAALLDWRAATPYGRRAHPTPEHFIPLFAAYGAAYGDNGAPPRAERLHHSITHGILAMDAYAFH
ncbi:protocatechuate 4,5-dioxygenase [Oryzomicrobium terrae]|uniref:Protocatechuate 4,5-dioxygenase n=1 Tax=Oryzomicrobium terrae TaxID=1735038 RepID=A0A5C1E925_9RHOO|nr:class III extradiol ring-cleavage dioxygenase [Oryzomicrobium terrae]QEL65165.1 protocatechuate 4,5-dioxygenase [Oryzomicrobium terrae]